MQWMDPEPSDLHGIVESIKFTFPFCLKCVVKSISTGLHPLIPITLSYYIEGGTSTLAITGGCSPLATPKAYTLLLPPPGHTLFCSPPPTEDATLATPLTTPMYSKVKSKVQILGTTCSVFLPHKRTSIT